MSDNDFSGFDSIIKSLKLPDFSQVQVPQYHVNDFTVIDDELMKEIDRINQEKHLREVENNESLKALVNYNEEITCYNRELVSLNEKILNKINSLDDTLIFLNESFLNKVENDKESNIKNQALLLELITIIDAKDSSKLEKFMSTLGAPVAAGLIVEYFKFKLGLS